MAKPAYQIHEATVPVLTAAVAVTNPTSLITPTMTATRLVHPATPMGELALAVVASLKDSSTQLARASEADRAAYLDRRADKITRAHLHNLPRQEWQGVKRPLAFGGRPPGVTLEGAEVLAGHDEDPPGDFDFGAHAEAELDHLALPGRSTMREPREICDANGGRAAEASSTRVPRDAPLPNLVARREN